MSFLCYSRAEEAEAGETASRTAAFSALPQVSRRGFLQEGTGREGEGGRFSRRRRLVSKVENDFF